MLSIQNLSAKMLEKMEALSPNNQENTSDNDSLKDMRKQFAEDMAKNIVEEVQNADIVYSSGLVAGPYPVSGKFGGNLE